MWGSAEPIQNGSREHTKYKIHVLKVISASARESKNNFSLQIKVCVALSRTLTRTHIRADTDLLSIFFKAGCAHPFRLLCSTYFHLRKLRYGHWRGSSAG